MTRHIKVPPFTAKLGKTSGQRTITLGSLALHLAECEIANDSQDVKLFCHLLRDQLKKTA